MRRSILTIFFFFAIYYNAFSQWNQTGGPKGGEASDILNIGTELFISMWNGGIYKSINNGDSWEWSSNGFPCNTGVTAFFEHDGVLYVSLWYNGIYMSSNKGASWEPINNGINSQTFYDIYVEGNDIYAASSEGGIYYSPNGGNTWSDKTNGIWVANRSYEDFISFNDKIYVGGLNLYESSNNGDSWTVVNVPGLGINGVRSLFEDNGVFYIGGDGLIHVSRDNMVTWDVFNLPFPAGTISNIYRFGNRVYFTNAQGQYYYTEDDGQSWNNVTTSATAYFIYSLHLQDNKILIGTKGGIYQSFDNGISWELNNTGIKAANISALGKDNNYIYSGALSQGMFRSSNNGQSWELINNGLNDNNSRNVLEILTLGNNIFIVTGGGVYSSSNSGDLWEKIYDPGVNSGVSTINYSNGLLLISVGLDFYSSFDNGVTWNLIPNNLNNPNRSIHKSAFQNNDIVIYDGEDMFVSQDSGSTFIKRNIPNGYFYVYDLEFINNRIYASTSRGLFYSNNLGVTWQQLHNDSRLFTDIVIDSDIIYATSDTGIYVTTEDKQKWYPLCDGIGGQFVNNIILHNNTFFAGAFNSSVWSRSKENINNVFAASYEVKTLSVCNSSGSLDLTQELTGSAQSGGQWSPALSSGTNIFDPSVDPAGTYEYQYAPETSFCNCNLTLKIDVTVTESLSAGQNGIAEICISETPIDLFESLLGNPDFGGQWTPSLVSGTGIFDPALDVEGTYTYSVGNNNTGNCSLDTAEVTVVIEQEPNAGQDGALTICSNDNSLDLISIIGGNPDIDGYWTPALQSGNNLFDPSNESSGTYVYTVSNGGCESSSEVTVLVNQEPNAGVNSNLSICNNSDNVNLLNLMDGNPDSGGTWSPSLNSGNSLFNPLYDTAGIYVYTVSNNNCGVSTAVVNIALLDVFEISNYTINGSSFNGSNSIEILINSNMDYEYSLDGFTFQASNVFTNLAGGDYTIHVREIDGCGRLEETISIIDFPKFFTPNGDGYNDLWKLKGTTLKSYYVYIYDRYGKLLKQMNEFDKGWNGVYNGYALPATDYWYRIYFEDGSVYSGHFSLKR